MKPTDQTAPRPTEPRDIEFQNRLPAGPFTYHREVRWGETDPARIAYTGFLPSMCLEAIESWLTACIGVNWYEANLDHGFGMPFVHLSCDFTAPVTPRHPFELSVFVDRVGTSSLRTKVVGKQDEKNCLTGEFINVFVNNKTMEPWEIPAAIRANLRRYAENQGPMTPRSDSDA